MPGAPEEPLPTDALQAARTLASNGPVQLGWAFVPPSAVPGYLDRVIFSFPHPTASGAVAASVRGPNWMFPRRFGAIEPVRVST